MIRCQDTWLSSPYRGAPRHASDAGPSRPAASEAVIQPPPFFGHASPHSPCSDRRRGPRRLVDDQDARSVGSASLPLLESLRTAASAAMSPSRAQVCSTSSFSLGTIALPYSTQSWLPLRAAQNGGERVPTRKAAPLPGSRVRRRAALGERDELTSDPRMTTGRARPPHLSREPESRA